MNDRVTRRAVLRRAFVMALGALGFGTAAGRMSAAMAATAGGGDGPGADGAQAGDGPGGNELRLYGVDWRRRSPGSKFGEAPAPGERATVCGRLLDGPDGAQVGDFQAVSVLGDWQIAASGLASAVELHTFTLSDGAVFGMGVVADGSRVDGAGTFAVTGGTGRYAGARGTYTAEQSPWDLGGDGTAEFTITLL